MPGVSTTVPDVTALWVGRERMATRSGVSVNTAACKLEGRATLRFNVNARGERVCGVIGVPLKCHRRAA